MRGPKPFVPRRKLDPKAAHARVLDVLLRSAGPGLKPGILHRTAQKVAALILRWPGSSKDFIHFTTLAAVHDLGDREDPLSEQVILALSRYVLRGKVIPVQRLQALLQEAQAGYLARCPCRASGRVQDLDVALPEAAGDQALLAAILDLWQDSRVREETAPPLARRLERVARARCEGRKGGSLRDLQAEVWPYWEILLDHPGYDPCWRKGLSSNHKVWKLPLRLLSLWVDALYQSRGVVYTHMEAVGLPYAICSCPGPEADRGCILTHWHYFSGNDEVLLPNTTEAFGQRKDSSGAVLPCKKHPERSNRPCLGCGCEHPLSGKKDPRG